MVETFQVVLIRKGGYATTAFKIKKDGITKYHHHRMHRLINQTPHNKQTDHINGLRYDNRRCNLRTVSNTQNCANNHNHRPTSILPGVFIQYKKSGVIKYRSRIVINGIDHNLGHFDTALEAHEAYVKEKEKRKIDAFNNPV